MPRGGQKRPVEVEVDETGTSSKQKMCKIAEPADQPPAGDVGPTDPASSGVSDMSGQAVISGLQIPDTGVADTLGKAPVVLGPLQNYLKDAQWKRVLGPEFEQPDFKELEKTLRAEYQQGKEIFPPRDLIFNAFNLTPLDEVKVVILGQDPYDSYGQAMCLYFSADKGNGSILLGGKRYSCDPSLRNIYKELVRDPMIEGFAVPNNGCLVPWAQQGVLLLNATLTVENNRQNNHSKFGWQTFTDNVINAISENCNHVVFILMGAYAHKKEKLVNKEKHCIIKTAHPSPHPYSKFPNCGCFSNCNAALERFGRKPIDWSL